MHDTSAIDFARIAQDLQIRKVLVENVAQLLDAGNSVPFITRYRKERTGGLNEDLIRQIRGRVNQQRQLADRKQTILKSLESQGKLTEDLRGAIQAAEHPRRLEDLYLPYKPRKKSPAAAARERGLEPLALAIWTRDPVAANLDEVLTSLINPEKQLPTVDEVRVGVQQILAEIIAEQAELRAAVRAVLWDTGRLSTTKAESVTEGQGLDYKDYFQFTEPVRVIPPHRILAINRGEKEGTLKGRLEYDADKVQRALREKLPLGDHPHAAFLSAIAEDSLAKVLLPALERELRRELTDRAEQHAVQVFARNLRSLLLQTPLRNRRVLAIDPGLRSGCKVAVLDEQGNLLADAVLYPHPPQNKKADAKAKLDSLVRVHGVQVIAIGNGAACRQTEELVAEVIAELMNPPPPRAPAVPAPAAVAPVEVTVSDFPVVIAPAAEAAPSGATAEVSPSSPAVAVEPAIVASEPAPAPAPAPKPPMDVAYIIVNEAGASEYARSPVGREEFPSHDAALRATISIGRRLQDPLSEMVKVDPQNIGVGLYQHDVNPRLLSETLEAVVESSVNHVGVEVNTATASLLRHVSGLNPLLARDIVEHRKQQGPFRTREQLLQVPGITPERYAQAAGFIRIPGGDNPLDHTLVHPESYAAAERMLADVGLSLPSLNDPALAAVLVEKLRTLSPEEISRRLEVGIPTVRDILEAMERPNHDPRDDQPPPIFKKGLLQLELLQPGMELKGTVLNVVDFGAFVDIGLKDSGLVHISQLANRYIKNPYDVVYVGQVVTVWVLNVDRERRRVSLTMIPPGTERRPPEPKPQPAQAGRGGGGRPPRGRRPGPGGGPPRRAPAPSGAPAPVTSEPVETRAPARTPEPQPASSPPPRHLPPRRPRPAPKPKLTQAALQGKAPLRTFGELSAFLEAKKDEPTPQTNETPKEEPPAEAPPSS